jgi:hypothetical protein
MVAEPSRQEKRILPVDMDQKTICGRIAQFIGVASGCQNETCQHSELKNLHANLSKSCNPRDSTIAVSGREIFRELCGKRGNCFYRQSDLRR